MVDLESLKTMLQLTTNKQDDLLQLIIDNTEQALSFKLGTDKVPDELSYIAMEVCVRRYNRLANEGMSSYSQEGQTITFNSSDFDDFLDDINAWRERNGKNVKSLGHVQFFNPYRGDSRALQSRN